MYWPVVAVLCALLSAAPVKPGPRARTAPAARAPEARPAQAPPAAARPPDVELQRAGDTMLVLELRPVGIGPDEAHMVTVQVAELAAQRSTGRVLTTAEVNDLVEHQKTLTLTDCQSEACIAELSKVANARRVLSGSVGKVGVAFVVNLTVVDVEKTMALGSGNRSVPTLDELLAALPGLVSEVLHGGDAGTRPRYALPAGGSLTMAVFDLKPLGITKETADNLTQVLAAELKQVEGARVISRDDIASMLEMEMQKDKLGCEGETSCLAEVGGALGVDKLVIGHAGKLGDSYVVSLRLIDVKAVSVDNRVTEIFYGQEDQLIRAVRAAGRSLLGVEAKAPGILALSASEPAAEVFVNERRVGAMPLPPLADLSPGRHQVRLSKPGFLDWHSDVYVEPAATSAVWVQLQEAPPRWYQRWWVWTVVGAVALGGGVAALYASQAGSKSSTVDVVVP
jgi:TolB-like protein